MPPGFFHLDLRRGARADMLVSAMTSFLKDTSSITNALSALGLDEVSVGISESAEQGIKSRVLRFYVGDVEISQVSECSQTVKNEFLRRCVAGDAIDLKELSGIFMNDKLQPAVAALSLKVLANLLAAPFEKIDLRGCDALFVVCHVVALVAQLDALDPKFVTCTNICLSKKPRPSAGFLSLMDDVWLNHVLIGVPVIEVEDEIAIDVVAIAFIKALAGNFSLRSESMIVDVGVGTSVHAFGMAQALWCEARMPASMNECGAFNSERVTSLHEISAHCSATSDMHQLATSLSLHGAVSIVWHLVSGEKHQTFYAMRFLVCDEHKRDAIEAMLVKGGAHDVMVRVVERHELNRRIVAVPIGTGNKTSTARFYEYIYFNKIVRVEPFTEDLESYVKKTDYSVDVARGDLLWAWKKWRGRLVSEDA